MYQQRLPEIKIYIRHLSFPYFYHLNPDWLNANLYLLHEDLFVLGYFSRITSGQLCYSDVMILFDLYIIFELFSKL